MYKQFKYVTVELSSSVSLSFSDPLRTLSCRQEMKLINSSRKTLPALRLRIYDRMSWRFASLADLDLVFYSPFSLFSVNDFDDNSSNVVAS